MNIPKLLIYEYVSAAGEQSLGGEGAALQREGAAMLCALLSDFSQSGDVAVHSLWHRSWGGVPATPGVNWGLTDGEQGDEAEFRQALLRMDAVLIVAPECHEILERLTQLAEESGVQVLGSESRAIRLCADKWKLFQHFQTVGVPTIPTTLHDRSDPQWSFPLIVKPRFGVGSHEIWLCRDRADWEQLVGQSSVTDGTENWICQPYLAGAALSVAVWCDPMTHQAHPWPVCTQRLSTEGRFHYQGGLVPARILDPQRVARTAREACLSVPGLRGYVGVDLVLSDTGEVFVVEINPRLTTSYVGYRRLAEDNLARCWWEPQFADRVVWRCGSIGFNSDGSEVPEESTEDT